MNNQRSTFRPITKSVGIVNEPVKQSNETYYSYSYNIWSNESSYELFPSGQFNPDVLNVDSPSSSCSSSTVSSSPTSSIGLMTSEPTSAQYDQVINKPKRQLPSTKAQSEWINKCIEKNKKFSTNKVLACSFCKNNGEPHHIYTSHSLKDSIGRITCPLLKIYKCPICGESGQNAHTLTYCKQFKTSKRQNILNTVSNRS